MIGSDLIERGLRVIEIDEMPGTGALLLDKLRPRALRRYHVPGITSTLVNAMMLASQARQREARRRANLCFMPPLVGIGMLDWKKFDAIVDLGYRHATEILGQASSNDAARLKGAGVPVRGVILRGREG